MAVRDVKHDANVIAELDATCMSFPRTAMLPSAHHLGGQGKRALPLTRPFGRSCDFGGRSCSKIMKLLLKVEAAGIEPASESTRPGRTTCLARAFRHPEADHGQPASGPSPNESRPAPSGRHAGPADFFGGTDRRHRLGSGIPSRWTALGGEREVNVVVGFCGFARRLKR